MRAPPNILVVLRQHVSKCTRGPVLDLLYWWEASTIPCSASNGVHGLQSWWADRIAQGTLQELSQMGTVRSPLRLQVQTSDDVSEGRPLSILSSQQPTAIPGCDLRLALRWWLGIPLVSVAGGFAACPASGAPLDVFGGHTVSCAFNGFLVRHQILQVAWLSAAVTKRAGLPIRSKSRVMALSALRSSFPTGRMVARMWWTFCLPPPLFL